MTLNEYCKKVQMTKATIDLIKELKKFADEDDYIIGTLIELKTDDEKRLLTEYIKNGENVTYESIILLSMEINLNRNKNY